MPGKKQCHKKNLKKKRRNKERCNIHTYSKINLVQSMNINTPK